MGANPGESVMVRIFVFGTMFAVGAVTIMGLSCVLCHFLTTTFGVDFSWVSPFVLPVLLFMVFGCYAGLGFSATSSDKTHTTEGPIY
ncbi:MAG: hypothetical protein QG577_958 [Thermodesulfobacteriota bacterium]|nr:hypothetical protein [Thermodesulfobacteriota bacterium]